LGPLVETQLRNAISIGEGSTMTILQRLMTLGQFGVVLSIFILSRLMQMCPSEFG
jgi:TctA family transporter